MNLSILRHASAGTRRLNPLLDVKRPLDKDGKHRPQQEPAKAKLVKPATFRTPGAFIRLH